MKREFDEQITLALARVVAHICADGYLGISKQRRSKKELLVHKRKKNLIRKKYYVRYTNTEPALSKSFIQDIKEVFNRKVIPLRRHDFEVDGKWIYDIFKKFGAGKSHEWYVANEFLQSESVMCAWLQAFFDDEAHISLSHRRIVLNMVNKRGLQQVQTMLKSLGIESVLRGPYKHKGFQSHHLVISKKYLSIYKEKIGFLHPEKKKKVGTLGLSH